MRVGILAHSTNPRGGVVHAMHLAEGLCRLGMPATLLAPALPGQSFFRVPRCAAVLIPAEPVQGTAAMVEKRVGEIGRFLAAPGAPRFDVLHAQDPISANALSLLAGGAAGSAGFVRTVHHLDEYADPRLAAWQESGLRVADLVLCVSRLWQDILKRDWGIEATSIGNGVDCGRFRPSCGEEDARDEAALRTRLGLRDAPVLLCLGGIEARKNTLGVLRAFALLRARHPTAQLVVAGGATLLDHTEARALFLAELRTLGLSGAVVFAGVVPDRDMPVLYRLADALVFASLCEGFGLCALEAMACGRPAIVSAIAPFTEHLGPEDCLWVDPTDPASIAHAMSEALLAPVARRLSRQGPLAAARFGWDAVAARHLPLYAQLHLSAPDRLRDGVPVRARTAGGKASAGAGLEIALAGKDAHA